MRLSWIADRSIGRMIGEYIATSFAGSVTVTVFSLAAKPHGSFQQTVFDAAVAR
jgi:hypothetical protein